MEIKDNLEFEKLDREGVNTLVKWAKEEGWNPGPYDAEVYYATDPDGFYGYYHNGELIAGGAIISYGGKFGFMGLFIVRPDYRGYGIGRKLWYERRDKLLSRLDEGAWTAWWTCSHFIEKADFKQPSGMSDMRTGAKAMQFIRTYTRLPKKTSLQYYNTTTLVLACRGRNS